MTRDDVLARIHDETGIDPAPALAAASATREANTATTESPDAREPAAWRRHRCHSSS
jgi:hypothetical protein